MSHPRRQRRGSNAIEFALLMPVYLLIVFGVVDFSWLMYHQASLSAAAHVGCREATMVDPGLDEANMALVTTEAETQMENYFETSGPGCNGNCTTAAVPVGDRPGRSIRCTVSVQFEPLTGFVTPSQILDATSIMRLEFQRGDSAP